MTETETDYQVVHEHKEEHELDSIEVVRHSLSVRACHWGIVITGIILGLTGLQIGGIYGFKIVEAQSFALHLWTALIFGSLWIFFAYYMFVYEWKWIGVGRIPYGIRFLLAETRAWFGGKHVEDPRAYDKESRKYREKIVPTQVMVWWSYLFLTILMGATGLTMYYRWDPLIDLGAAIGTYFGASDGYIFLRAVHRFGMFLFATEMFMHVYAVVIFGALKSMVTGIRKEKIAKD